MNEDDPDFQKGLKYKLVGDCKSAKEAWLIAAKKGNVNALHSLGFLFYEGVGFKKDYEMAIKYWEAAGKKKHPRSLFNLGLLYSNGDGLSQDLRKSLGYFEQASVFGCKEADPFIIDIKQKLELQRLSNYIKATQSGIVRMDCDTFPIELEGLCTDGLNTCFCFIIISNTKKRFSLVHTATEADANEIIKECLWVGGSCIIYIIKGSYYNNEEREKFRIEQTTLVSRLEALVTKNAYPIKLDYQYITIPAFSVSVSRKGSITILEKFDINFSLATKDCSSPHNVYRNAINMLNVHSFHALDLQYDGTKWTKIPKINVQARELISKIDKLEPILEYKRHHFNEFNEYYKKFKEMVEKHNETGLKFYKEKEFLKAKEEFLKALGFFDLLIIDETKAIWEKQSIVYYNLGSVLLELQQWDEALENLRLAHTFKEKLNVNSEQLKKVEQKINYVQTLLQQLKQQEEPVISQNTIQTNYEEIIPCLSTDSYSSAKPFP